MQGLETSPMLPALAADQTLGGLTWEPIWPDGLRGAGGRDRPTGPARGRCGLGLAHLLENSWAVSGPVGTGPSQGYLQPAWNKGSDCPILPLWGHVHVSLARLFAFSAPQTLSMARGLEGVMVAPVTNHKAVVELPEGSCGSGWCRNPLPELTGGDMCLHFSREDGGPLKSHRAQGVGPCCSLECSPPGVASPALEALLTSNGPRPSPPGGFQASTYSVFSAKCPFLGLCPLGAEIRLAQYRRRSCGLDGIWTPPTPNGPKQVSGREGAILSFVTLLAIVRTRSAI